MPATPCMRRPVRVEMLPPALPGLLTTVGAGGGAWAGTVLDHPVAVAGRLAIGCAAGLPLALLPFRALERAVADSVDHGGAGCDERRGNRLWTRPAGRPAVVRCAPGR
ncbi:hypothetical protein ABVB69_16015 [Streptomyces sp. NPDC000349]|uniref:hypothetical protein n=1 Tax=unclassified Streptomyces TaxID=2593676 RepID=UPI0027879A22|nr:hypothetical protein [Streptomyces sp. DSM 40167]MDQ0407925.1 hypothetical protein [Streptomyces sp. DSM 40167]